MVLSYTKPGGIWSPVMRQLRIDAGTQQRHVKLEQHLVALKDVEIAFLDEILQDDVELAAVGEGKARLFEQSVRLWKRQFQRDSKGEHGGLDKKSSISWQPFIP